MKSLLLSILLFFFCEYAYSQKPVNPKDYPGVLINGLYWSEYNVDAPGTFTSLPEEFGMLYRWNSQIPIPREGDVEDRGTSYDYWKDANNPCPDGWRLPTRQDTASINDLTRVDKEYTSLRGINGYRFTDKTTGNSIFFPMAGYREPSKPVTAENRMGVYWTKLIDYHVSKAGLAINFISSKWFFGGKKFSTASSVRCVRECPLGCECIKRDTSVTIYTKDLPYDFCDTTFKEGTGTGIYTFRDLSFRGCDSIVRLHLTVKPTNPVNPKEYPGVLINGRYWSEYNVDAPGTFTDSPEAYGMLYPWGSKIPIPRVGEAANSADASNDWKDVNNPCPAGWRLPKEEDILSIGDETKVDREQVLLHGINGHKFTDKSTGNSVFFPWAGIRWPGTPVRDENKSGSYWTSETPENFPQWHKKSLLIYNKAFLCITDEFATGLSIRCIREHPPCKSIKRDTSVTICAKDLPYDFCDTTFEEGTMSGTYVFQRIQILTGCDSIVTLNLTVNPECDKPCPGVLINGVCWAKSNVDKPGTFAPTPEAWGMSYQWNRKKGWPPNESTKGEENITGDRWETVNDPCPAGWRVPAIEEMETLIDEERVTYVYEKDKGYRFIDKATGNFIFLPFAESFNTSSAAKGYWSSTGKDNMAWILYIFQPFSHAYIMDFPSESGWSVRCVADWNVPECKDIERDTSVTICAKDLPYDFCDTVFQEGTVSGTYIFRCIQALTGCDSIVTLNLTVKSECDKPCPGVLINGVCWAKYNVDAPGTFANAAKPYGMLYQWNRKKAWPLRGSVTGWDNSLDPGNWDEENDPCPNGWRMPTLEEMNALVDATKVTYTETAQDGVWGARFRDNMTGKSIFLPNAGYRHKDGIFNYNYRTYYWSGESNWYLDRAHVAQQEFINFGYSVRCVAHEKDCDVMLALSETICQEELPYHWRDTTFGIGTETGEYCFRRPRQGMKCDSVVYLYLTVDTLCNKPCKEGGIRINGVCWAECNVDEPGTFAASPESFGKLYQWNRKKGWDATGSGWDNSHSDKDNWEADNDPCPRGWKVPDITEINRLLDNLKVTHEYTQQKGVNGSKFTDNATGNTIFLPAINNSWFFYWSASADWFTNLSMFSDNELAWSLLIGSFSHNPELILKKNANPVRCVTDWGVKECESITEEVYDSVCVNELPYRWRDTVFKEGTETGVYRFMRTNATGCDSTVTLHLTVHPSPHLKFTGVVCQGGDYNWDGFNLLKVQRDTMVHDTVQTKWGCDSVRTLYLTVHPVYDTTFYDTVCQGDDYNRYGFILKNVQTDYAQTLSLKSVHGCDSTVTLFLTVHTASDTIVYDTVCQGDPYHGYGFALTSAETSTEGTLTRDSIYESIHGCDSLVTLNLFVGKSYLFQTPREICQGDTVMWRGKSYDKERTYEEAFTTIHGCDSVYRLILTVHPSPRLEFFGEVCQGKSYNEDGFFVPSATKDTVVRQELKTHHQCDSVRTLYLTVHPVYDTVVYDTVCQGDPYHGYGFTLTEIETSNGGTLTRDSIYKSIHGCDSSVHLHLFVGKTYLFETEREICQGDTVMWRGKQYDTQGTYEEPFTTVHGGCDSVYRLHLTVHPSPRLEFFGEVCQGEGYNEDGFFVPSVTKDTVVRQELKTRWNCDSVWTLYLTVHPVYDTIVRDTVCQGDAYHRHGVSISYAQPSGDGKPAMYKKTYPSMHGCDSTVTLFLTVHPASDTILYDAICRGDGYRNHGFSLDASQFLKEGTYSFSRKERNMHGCDSTIHLSLTVHPDYLFPRTEHICQGETFEFRDKVYDATGLYAERLETVHGCDSVYTLSLTVHPVYDVRLKGVLCEGEAFTRYGFDVREAGVHVLHLRSVHGCDSTVTLTLTEEKKVEGSIGFLLEDCTKHGYGFEFSPSIPVREWMWDMGDGTAYRTEEGYHRYADSGTYRVLLRTLTDNGCGNEFLHVQRVPPYLDRVTVHADRQVVDEEYPTVHFRAEVLPGMECEWDFGDGTTGKGSRTEHSYATMEARTYEVTLRVTNEDGCITESTLDIEAVVFPKAVNTFSPNGDGINDVFMVGFRIEIMNRNGLKIYSGGNGWDGTYKGGEAKEDTYFYRVTFRTATGERTKTGYVNLIR